MGRQEENNEDNDEPQPGSKAAREDANGHSHELTSVEFPIFSYDEDGLVSVITEILDTAGVISHWKISTSRLGHFLLTVKSNYRANPYHNFRHAFCVTQIVYSLLDLLSPDVNLDLDSWGVLIFAAISHDVDHPGVANSFLKNSCDALYILYGDSGTLEHHHFSTLCKILHNRENDIFANVLSKKSTLLRRIKELILCTDMAKQPAFIASASKKDSLSIDETLKLFLKCADISNEVRPKPIAQKIVDSLYQEMKLEKGLATSLNIPQSAICAIPREQQQLNFHKNCVLPLFNVLLKAFPRTRDTFWRPLAASAQDYALVEDNEEESSVAPKT